MKMIAKAKTPGRCVYAPCQCAAGKIYEDEHWRVMACSEAHAAKALEVVNRFPPEDVKNYLILVKNQQVKS